MTLSDKINQWKSEFEDILFMGDEMTLYSHIIDLGKKLNQNPLNESLRNEHTRVSYCQFQLFVDWEDGQWKSYSDGMISAGYAYILVDIFNSITPEEASQAQPEDFNELGLQDMLSMNRTNGLNQMISIMANRAKTI